VKTWIDNPDNRVAALATVSYLALLDAGELRELAASATVRRVPAGGSLFEEGEDCRGLYVIASGRVRIVKLSAEGREQVLHTEHRGALGEAPLLDGEGYPGSARAVEDAVLLFLPRTAVLDGCRRRPEVALGMATVIARRVRRFADLAEMLALHKLHRRFAAYLVRLAEKPLGTQASRRPDGPVEIVLRESNQEIAAQIGTVRELVSRLLGELKRQGLIEVAGRRVTIFDVERLRDAGAPSDCRWDATAPGGAGYRDAAGADAAGSRRGTRTKSPAS
jgi:CRP-like cAMP-binding protein